MPHALIAGIHHITAIATDPNVTIDFYTRVLGLRLVKKSVNQDDVATYHLFFGDRTGEPGMDLTFFTFQPAMPGLRGTGQVTTVSLAVPETALEWWIKRFDQLGVEHEGLRQDFNRSRIVFYDPDQQRLELVGINQQEMSQFSDHVWTTDEVNETVAIRYFYSAKLSVESDALIEPILQTILGYAKIDQQQNVLLYKLPHAERAAFLELEEAPSLEPGLTAAGTVHHIAFEVEDEAAQLEVRDRVLELGLHPTQVINRFYFKSVYFRTPAGILFEIATKGPGFTADEPEAELGEKLALPPFLEPRRAEIEAGLPPIA